MKKSNVKRWMWGYFFVAPTIIGLFILNIWPIIQTFILSVSKSLGFGAYQLSGLENYTRMFADGQIWISLRNTLIFSLVSVPVSICISIGIAWLMTRKIRAVGIYRVIYFTPMVAAPAATAMVWSFIFNTEYGFINNVLRLFSLQPRSWLQDPRYAMACLICIAIWGSIGQQIVLLIVAIKNVPQTYYEAAALDGAGGFKSLVRITVPLISPNIFFLTITGFIGSLRQFDLVYMLYKDNTSKAMDSVRTIMFQYYREAFVIQDKAYASAIAVFTLVVILLFTALQFLLQKKAVHYD